MEEILFLALLGYNRNITLFNSKVYNLVISYMYILQNDYHVSLTLHVSCHIITIFLVCVLRMFKIYSLSNFQIYHTVLLAIVSMLYIVSPESNCLFTGSLYPSTTFTHFFYRLPQPLFLSRTSLFSVSVVLDFMCKWDHTVFVSLHLTDFT